jgi:hypothetical protein
MRVRKTDRDGELAVRDSLVAVFFFQRPYPKLVKTFGEVFELWLARVSDDAKRWAMVGPDAEEYKRVDPRVLTRARSQLDPAKTKKGDMYALELGGPEEINPTYQFVFEGSKDIQDDETNYLELRFASEDAAPARVEDLVEFLTLVASKLPFDSGYASLALTVGVESQQDEYAKKAAPLLFRHPGFDVPNSGATNSGMGKRVRGAYWLTFLGAEALEKLGGGKKLRKNLASEIEQREVGPGVMLRAGKVPEVGDVNKGDTLPLLRSLAKTLEPVLNLDDRYLDNMFVDEDARAKWERRHLT